jgi:putative ABC transport system permease protein
MDVVRESWIELSRRPTRTVVTGLGVGLGTAAVVATQGLVATVRFQVSDEFDATLATQVEVRRTSPPGDHGGSLGDPGDAEDAGEVLDAGSAVDFAGDSQDTSPSSGARPGAWFPPDEEALERAAALSGVEGIAVLRDSQQELPVALSPVEDSLSLSEAAQVRGIDSAGLGAVGAEISGHMWSVWHDATAQRVALIGRLTADELGLVEVRPGDRVFVSGVGFTLLGIVEDGGRASSLRNGVVVPVATTDLFLMDQERDRLLVVTAPGAAQDVEAVVPVALSPTHPERFSAYAPTQSDALRRTVDRRLHTLGITLGGVVIVLGLISIGNATLTSVLQRFNEIGIRRALGARPRHIAVHIVFDAALTGAVGGSIGAVGGLATVLAVTARQGWQPVLDPWLPPGAITAGALVGVVAGLYPAWIGSRLQPTEALRRE